MACVKSRCHERLEGRILPQKPVNVSRRYTTTVKCKELSTWHVEDIKV